MLRIDEETKDIKRYTFKGVNSKCQKKINISKHEKESTVTINKNFWSRAVGPKSNVSKYGKKSAEYALTDVIKLIDDTN